MDLRQLQYVEAVARTLNFTRAARDLHVAQPALSKAIANLEAELGIRLFNRTSRSVKLTDAGTSFVVRVRRILADVTNLELEMDEFGRGAAGKVRISTWYHLEPMLPKLLHDFIEQNPHIEVSIVELAGTAMLDALRRGEIDLGVAIVAPQWDLTDIEQQLIRSEPMMVLLPSDDPLARQPTISLSLLADRAFIAPSAGTTARYWFDRLFSSVGIEPRVVVETNEIAAVQAYVSVGIGLAIAPQSIVPPVAEPASAVPLDGIPPIEVVLTWNQTGYRSPAGERALAFARAAVAPS
jgi:DNA-binding transcriptional LysR family regulator